MASRQLLVCKYCNRNNFKSELGLRQHQERSIACKLAKKNALEQVAKYEENMVDDISSKDDNSGEQVANMSFEIEDNSDREDTFSAADIVMLQDDDSWGLGSYDEEKDPQLEGYPGEALLQAKQYVAHVRDHLLPFGADEVAAITLMNVLMRKKASLDTYDDLMEWHLRNMPDGSPKRNYITRKKMITNLAWCYNMPTKTVTMAKNVKKGIDLVKKMPIVLPSSGAKVDIIYHDARDQVVSLLMDPRFGDDDFLHFDDNPLAPPPEKLDYIEDINTGLAYTKTYKKLITNPNKQMLVPIILYIDGAVTGQFDKLSVEALKMTLGILNKRARDREYSWRTLGYVPNFTGSDSRGKKIMKESGHAAAVLLPTEEDEGNIEQSDEDSDAASKAFQYNESENYDLHDEKEQDYHKILATILTSYRKLEKEGIVWDYKYRGKLYRGIELVFFVACVKCDTDEADKLCGKYRFRGRNVSQLCRYCTISTNQADWHNKPCGVKFKTWADIQRLVGKGKSDKLREMAQKEIVNAFHSIRFGQHSEQGIKLS